MKWNLKVYHLAVIKFAFCCHLYSLWGAIPLRFAWPIQLMLRNNAARCMSSAFLVTYFIPFLSS